MINIPHELRAEFPDEARLIERLERNNHDFKRLAAQYDEINRGIHRIETEEAPTSDEVLEDLKKRRLALKDEIATVLAKYEGRM